MDFPRVIKDKINKYLTGGHNLLLLGPRQTGKSTLIQDAISELKKKKILIYKLQDIYTYQQLLKDPSSLIKNVEEELKTNNVCLFIDEVQKIPILLDGCQYLIDQYKKKITVILTGSSARKLRKSGANLLPGRVLFNHLHSLILPEIKKQKEQRIIPIKFTPKKYPKENITLDDLLLYGSLPGILKEKEIRADLLESYVATYLEEEIRAESLSRNLSEFSKFLELSALESNTAPNLSKLSQETGVALATIKSYFQLLEDTLITYPIPIFQKLTRKQVLTTPKYIYYDLGVRNVASGMPLNKGILKTEIGGKLFEHFICLELIKRIKYFHPTWKYFFWRTNHGLEVDFIIQTDDEIIPIEIKYTDSPQARHISHLKIFMEEFKCNRGYVIGTFPRAMKLDDKISAIPWDEI